MDRIAAVKGVDMLFVGPADLKLAFSISGKQYFTDFDSALKFVVAAARGSNITAGILCRKPEDFKKYLDLGFTGLAYGSDIGILRNGFNDIRELSRSMQAG